MDPKVKEILSKAKVGAVDFGKAAGKTMNKVANQTKKNVKIFQLKTEIDVAYKEIGRLVYAIHHGDDVCSEAVQAQLEAIDSKNEEIAALKAELDDLKAKKEEAEAPAEKACECAEAVAEEAACKCECAEAAAEETACKCECAEAEEEKKECCCDQQ